MFERIGKIESTMLGFEIHGIMSFSLTFDFGVTKQEFGGYALGYTEDGGGIALVMAIIRACGVGKWEDIEGKTMYALYESVSPNEGPEGRSGRIIGIKALPFETGGTFLIKDWLKT